MNKPIYVFGHKNPDNDSIASAVAYAALKNATDPENTYIAARLGAMPAESAYVFERFGVEEPELIEHIHTRVGDVMKTDVISVSVNADMKTAGRIIAEQNLRAIPVLEDDGRVRGLLTDRELAMRYLHEIVELGATCDGTLCQTRVLKVTNLMETKLEFSSPDRLLSDAAEDLFSSADRELIVTDSDGKCVGILTRTDVVRGGKRRCILVDHNELSQSAPGVAEANVLEIIDHHRVGDVQTAGPILFYNMPVGSTATIVAARYNELDEPWSKQIAGILLSAILTDTVMLKSPTTAALDREIAEALATIAGVEIETFGHEILASRSVGSELDLATVLTADLKEYRRGVQTLAIVQYETVDTARALEHREAILAEMTAIANVRGYDAFVFMVTDIVREGSEIFAVGKTELVERELEIQLQDGSAWMPGVLSRKKQVAAKFLG